jgi:hypothetical protein
MESSEFGPSPNASVRRSMTEMAQMADAYLVALQLLGSGS